MSKRVESPEDSAAGIGDNVATGMHDSVRRRLEEMRSRTSPVCIERVTKGSEDNDSHLGAMSSHAASELKLRMAEMDVDAKVASAATKPAEAFGGTFKRRDHLENHFVERLGFDAFAPGKTLDLKIQPGTWLMGPPYDVDWSEGNGLGTFSRFDGRAFTIPKDNGFSAAGIGFFLTTTEAVLAAIMPHGTFDWNWAAFADLPSARTSGGMGVTIYTVGQSQPTATRQAVLWSVSGMTTFSGNKGTGLIADAASPTTGFGPIRLAPILLNMVPGSTYLVWVWSWQIAIGTTGKFTAFTRFDVPLVSINAGPPIPGPR